MEIGNICKENTSVPAVDSKPSPSYLISLPSASTTITVMEDERSRALLTRAANVNGRALERRRPWKFCQTLPPSPPDPRQPRPTDGRTDADGTNIMAK